MIEKIRRYVKKAYKLGPRKSAELFAARVVREIYQRAQKKKALNRELGHSWQSIAEKNNYAESFEIFFAHAAAQLQLDDSQIFINDIDPRELQNCASNFSHNCFDLLGSGKQCFTKIPWRSDFRCALQNDDHEFPLIYYKDILINVGQDDQQKKDIKVPWELSRFQHFATIGKAYELTPDEKYAQTFQDQINDWLENNPVLLGPNWVCPMDVAIRAINWIWAFHYFKDSKIISLVFWQKFIGSLYDHFDYLEHHWEVYDSRTSNHYFSDLIGYFYLCYFFKPFGKPVQKKAEWCFQECLREFDKQVFDEGTDYEGSTCYHKLIAEIIHHIFFVSELFGFEIQDVQKSKFERMIEFVNWCSFVPDQLVQIGDNDSGKIVSGQLPLLKKNNAQTLMHYKNFGISIFKKDRVHITLRHHAYQNRQPSGHHHNDVGSFTLAIDGVPVFVDPGSYIYTPSAFLRNKFRSAQMHNTFGIAGKEPVALDNRLFTLDLPENIHSEKNELHTFHDLYAPLRANRKIDVHENEILITDWWQSLSDESGEQIPTIWNFILAPEIAPVQEQNSLVFYRHDKTLGRFILPHSFTLVDDFFSPSYGTKIATTRIMMQSNKELNEISLCAFRYSKN
ncbi:MAG TPA: heparinase II/III family protein [Candidatus Babeliales bacterium]|nr:heparinase II/III family protein [Candidatus Babeliales bacterium]